MTLEFADVNTCMVQENGRQARKEVYITSQKMLHKGEPLL